MKMEFGVALGRSLKIGDIADHAKAAEESGFSHMTFVDQQNLDRDVYVMMTIAALNTHRIKIGQGVTQPYTFHPSVIANATATVDELSGGRVLLGIGSGGNALRSMGMKPRPVRELKETVLFIKKYMRGEEAEYMGAKMHSEWVRRPVPVYVATRGAKSGQIAGEVGDGAIIIGAHPVFIKWQIEQIEKGALKAGRDLSEIDIWTFAVVYIADSKEAAFRESSPFAANVARIYTLLKRDEPDIVDLRQRLEKAEPGLLDEFEQVHKVWDENSHELADSPHSKVVTQRVNDFINMTGTVDDICEQISKVQELGVKSIDAAVYSISDQKGMMREIGDKIMPHFRN